MFVKWRNYKITQSGKCLVRVWHRASVNKRLLLSEVSNHLGPRTVLLHDRRTRVMTTLSLIPPPFRKLTPMGTTERPSSPRSSLEGTAAVPRLEVGWGSQVKEEDIPQASQGLQSQTTSLTPWVNNCPWEPKLGSRDVPEPLRWVLCLPEVAWPAQRINFVSQFDSLCNFASNTCPIKYSNIKEMSKLENETPLSPTQITCS